MDIHIHIEKKQLLSFLVVIGLILGTSLTYAVVSHNANQIFFSDGTSLETRLGSGEQDPTVTAAWVKDGESWAELKATGTVPAGFADDQDNGITSCSYTGCTSQPAWGQLSGMPGGFADGVDDVGSTSCSYTGCTSQPAWGQLSGMPGGFADGVDNTGIGVCSDCNSNFLDQGGDTATGQLTVSINSAEGGSLRLANPGKNLDWVLYNMRGAYGDSFQIWNYPGGTPNQRFVITDNGNVGIGTYPSIKMAIVDGDSGFDGNSAGSIFLKTNNQNRIVVYGDSSGIRFYSESGSERIAIGGVGTSVAGNLIMNGGGYFKFPVRSSAPFQCNGIGDAGTAYVKDSSPEVLCVCQGDGEEWAWFGEEDGNQVKCAD